MASGKQYYGKDKSEDFFFFLSNRLGFFWSLENLESLTGYHKDISYIASNIFIAEIENQGEAEASGT